MLNHVIIPTDFIVGVSGGMDSMSLLTMLQRDGHTFRAVHINHNIHPDSRQWGEVVQSYCDTIDVPCDVIDVSVEDGNLEQAARKVRYQALSRYELPVLTAHHFDDQIETFFLRFKRGSTLECLTCMDETTHNGYCNVVRPLLAVNRKDIEEYVKDNDVPYIEDPSNNDIAHERNWLRNVLIPQLEDRFDGFRKGFDTSLSNLKRSQRREHDLIEVDLKYIQSGTSFSVERYLELPQERRLSVLVHVLKNMKYIPRSRTLYDIDKRLSGETKDDGLKKFTFGDIEMVYRVSKHFWFRHQ